MPGKRGLEKNNRSERKTDGKGSVIVWMRGRVLENIFKDLCHIANSGAVLNFANIHHDMVRAGICLTRLSFGRQGTRTITADDTGEKSPELFPFIRVGKY